MNEWAVAASILIAALAPCCWVILRAGFADGIVAVALAGTVATVALLAMAEGEHREGFADLALVLAVGSVVGSLVLARYLERTRGPQPRAEDEDE